MAWLGPLVGTHRDRLWRVARAEGLGPDDALDCVQEAFETFLRLPQAAALSARTHEAGPLLTTLCRNAARNQRRRHHRSRVHSEDGLDALQADVPLAEAQLEARADQLRLRGCVAELGELQRHVVTLRMLEERPGQDVAAALGVSPNHVAVLLRRAKEALRGCMLADEGPDR